MLKIVYFICLISIQSLLFENSVGRSFFFLATVGRSCYYYNHIHYIKLQMNECGQNCSSLKYIVLFSDQCFGNDGNFYIS